MPRDKPYFDMEGNPITLEKWVELFNDDFARRIGSDEETVMTINWKWFAYKSEQVFVSTVFTGINMNYHDGPPLTFETMIFGGKHDQYQERYATAAQAIEGHKKACKLAFGRKWTSGTN